VANVFTESAVRDRSTAVNFHWLLTLILFPSSLCECEEHPACISLHFPPATAEEDASAHHPAYHTAVAAPFATVPLGSWRSQRRRVRDWTKACCHFAERWYSLLLSRSFFHIASPAPGLPRNRQKAWSWESEARARELEALKLL